MYIYNYKYVYTIYKHFSDQIKYLHHIHYTVYIHYTRVVV